jgi:hypothetical protein
MAYQFNDTGISVNILSNVIATGAGTTYKTLRNGRCIFSIRGTTSSGSGSAIVMIQVSNNGTSWVDALTTGLTLTLGTTETSTGFAMDAPWIYARANVTTLTGTDATVTCLMTA